MYPSASLRVKKQKQKKNKRISEAPQLSCLNSIRPNTDLAFQY